MATTEDLLLRLKVRSLIRQLGVLEAQVQRQEPRKRFTDLQGIWEGKADFSLEESKAVEIRVADLPT
jgi:hypothetical protein